ncbi:DUF362 domain-containing protein [Oscillospiraceae bacterium MB08-C2-2]|nr:DUF362 domain-containing protein [Oscillospiraceae bacterium MB08-C2-2]
MEAISVYKTPDYTDEALERAVGGHFEALNLPALLRPEMKVTLKVNLLMRRRPEEATTTHPALVRAVIRRLKAEGITHITIADSPGGPYTTGALSGIYGATGMAALAEEEGVALNQTTGWKELSFPGGKVCHGFNIIEPVAGADLVINLPKLKTHAMTQLSGGVKNLFGCIPGLQKPELHFRFTDKKTFSGMLVDLSQLVAPGVTILDAVVAMEGDGPSSGTPRTVGLTLASTSPHALDLGLCHMMDMRPDEVFTVALGIERGLIPPAFDPACLVGEPEAFSVITDFKKPASRSTDFSDNMPAFLRRPMAFIRERFLAPRPVIHRTGCIGCGKCAESCPAKVITLRERKAYINYKGCIRCFCCHEMCPVKTIHISQSKLMKW